MKNSNDRLKAKIKDSYSKIAVDNSKTERMLGDIMAAVKDKKEKKKKCIFHRSCMCTDGGNSYFINHCDQEWN